ncbi:MAG: FAD:protein FMN transferase, partial [Planctomycetes bacterium]|nr:FAD:protein FMN transferase [Planctomycetota bacterium]
LTKHRFERVQFGNIPVELTIYAADAASAEAAAEAAFARVAELSAMMSDYAFEPPSALNRIAAEAPQPVAVPPELLRALQRAREMHALTGGAFDVTAKPFVHLWRTSRKLGELPPKHRIANARRYVGIDALTLDAERGTATLARQGMWLDLGGLAKGMIGDEVVALLKRRGLPRCRYRAGGDMVFGDAPPDTDGWTVRVPDLLVEDEQQQRRPLQFTIANGAASVSGDVHRFVEIDGVRYAHVVDPRTGLGVTDRRVACVRGRRGIDTDPLATAGLIMTERAWRAALAEVPGCRGQLAHVDR